MLAATLERVREIRVIEKPEPRIVDPGDAIVELELAGLCGSDLHPWSGREEGLDPGTTMGHELTGRIVEVGEYVRRFRLGDPVLSPFSTSCAACAPCRRGLSARCTEGGLLGWVSGRRGIEGAQAERVRIPLADTTLLARPAGLSPIEALLLGDVVSTGFFAVERADLGADCTVAVIGLGAVGLAAVLAARHAGASAVIGLDAIPERLELAASFGATVVPVVSARGSPRDAADLGAEVRRLTGGEGVACVVDAVGSAEATRLGVEVVRPGGFLSIVGVHTEPAFAVPPAAAYDRNLTLAIGRCPVRSRLDELCARQLRQRFPIERIVTHRVPLRDAADAYEMFAARRDGAIKVVFDPRG